MENFFLSARVPSTTTTRIDDFWTSGRVWSRSAVIPSSWLCCLKKNLSTVGFCRACWAKIGMAIHGWERRGRRSVCVYPSILSILCRRKVVRSRTLKVRERSPAIFFWSHSLTTTTMKRICPFDPSIRYGVSVAGGVVLV